MDLKEIENKLPSTWEELRLKEFIKLTELNIVEKGETDWVFVGAENTFRVLSALADLPQDEFEAVPMKEILPLVKKIDFLFTSNPEIKAESTIKWKRFEDVTYNDFITFQTLQQEPMKNLPLIIKAFAEKKMSDDEILSLNIADVMTGFFLQQMYVKRFLKNMKRSLILLLMKQKMKQLLRFIKR